MNEEPSAEVQVTVRRLIRVEYTVPLSAYISGMSAYDDGVDMTRDEIRKWESEQVDDPAVYLDCIVGEEVQVEFSDEDEVTGPQGELGRDD